MSRERGPRIRPPRITCPACGGSDSKITDSRPAIPENAVRRKRECQACHEVYFTIERFERRWHPAT